jgi:hypothetical protein
VCPTGKYFENDCDREDSWGSFEKKSAFWCCSSTEKLRETLGPTFAPELWKVNAWFMVHGFL